MSELLSEFFSGTTKPPGSREDFIAKDTGHRGPVIHVSSLTLRGRKFCFCVTPSSIFVISYTLGPSRVFLKRYPEAGDAFTAVSRTMIESGVIVGCQSGNIVQFDLAVNSFKFIFKSATSPIASIATSSDHLACGYSDGLIYLWKTITDTSPTIMMIADEKTACSAIAFADTDIWVGRSDGCISIIDNATCPTISPSPLTYPGMTAVTNLQRLSSLMAVVCVSSELSLWDLVTRTPLQRYQAELVTCGAMITSLTAVGESQLLIGGSDGSVCLREIRKTERLQCVLTSFWDPPDELHACPVTAACADGGGFITGDSGCRVRFI